MFQSAAGATREAKENNACRSCDDFPTKNKFVNTAKIESAVDEIETIWLENKSGYGRKLSELSPAQFESLLVWQDAMEKILSSQIPRLEEVYLATKGITK